MIIKPFIVVENYGEYSTIEEAQERIKQFKDQYNEIDLYILHNNNKKEENATLLRL